MEGLVILGLLVGIVVALAYLGRGKAGRSSHATAGTD